MERCPLEVWENIVALACTDGGVTGCSLSLVSRTMRAVVSPVRFHSIALTSSKQCFNFARALDGSDCPPPICHLFIAIAVGRTADVPAVSTILAKAAPTLRTLVLHGLYQFDIFTAPESFPALEDLSLPALHQVEGEPRVCRFPSLRRLHISMFAGYNVWKDLAMLMPTVTHLRLLTPNHSLGLVSFLRVLLDIPTQAHPPAHEHADERVYATFPLDTRFAPGSADERRAQELVASLPELAHVFIQQTAPSVLSRQRGMAVRLSGVVKAALAEMEQACRGRATRTLSLLPDAHAVPISSGYVGFELEYGVADAREHWLNLVEGGVGPWRA